MSQTPPEVALSPKLEQLLAQLPDRSWAASLRKVYGAAAGAISRLADIDLLKYETGASEGAPDLSLWEEMAPVIRDTVMDVNALLLVIREEFAPHPPGGLGDAVAQSLERTSPSTSSQHPNGRKVAEVESLLREAQVQLAQEISRLGERMRSPAVVSDRWNLLADLQSFRAKFRERIGSMIYATASAFGEVHRNEVVPLHQEELDSAVNLRSTVSDLARVIEARLRSIQEAETEDLQWNAQQLQKELDSFGRTPVYKVLRAQDKRVVIELRHRLAATLLQSSASKKDLLEKVEPFAAFVNSLSHINRRELLINHDRELCAACGVKLEQALQLASTDPSTAAALLFEAAAAAQPLYGRDIELDAFLRRARKNDLSVLRGIELGQLLERFVGILAGLPLYEPNS